MKHAYLIMAHNEFEVLRYLLKGLDDERNDIYIHFDKKVKVLPDLSLMKSNLYIVENRIDVRWGHSSQITAELELYAQAFDQQAYSFFHLISGVHLPLYTQDFLHTFFDKQPDANFLMKMPTSVEEVNMKMRYRHFFLRNFIHRNSFLQRLDQLVWHIILKIQKLAFLKRYKTLSFVKASQWKSLNRQAVAYLLEQRAELEKRYRYTFCPDEFFVLSELSRSPLANTIVDATYLLKCDFVGTGPRLFVNEDYNLLMSSGCFFARKFSHQDLSIVERVIKNLKQKE